MPLNFQAQHKQSMYYSFLGLLLVFGWLMLAYYQALIAPPPAHENQFVTSALALIYSYLFNGKVFTLWCFIMGLHLYVHIENNVRTQTHLFHSAVLLAGALLLALFNSIFLVLVPLIIFRLIIYAVQVISSRALFILTVILFLAICWLAFVPEGVLSIQPYFIDLYPIVFRWESLSLLVQQLTSPVSQVQFGYGFFVMIFGFLAAKTKWLVEYHFYYQELKKLFIYSLLLFLLWGLLNYFNLYQLITGWRIGAVFYTLDALSINIISTFMFVFLLIYFENFRWGKWALKILANAGHRWILHLFFMILALLLGPRLVWLPSLLYAMGFSLIIFGMLSMGSPQQGKTLIKISTFLQRYL